MCSERIRPPGTAARSSSTDSTPSRASRWASVQPVRPAPTISTRGTSKPYPAGSRVARALVAARAPELVGDVLDRVEQRPDRLVAVAPPGRPSEPLAREAQAPPQEARAALRRNRAGVVAVEPGAGRSVDQLL